MSYQPTPSPSIEQLTTEFPGVDFRIVPWNNRYAVGDDGSVWCCRTRGGIVLDHWRRMTLVPVAPDGRFIVGLRDGKKLHRPYVHVLILTVFVGECPPGLEGCHDDGDPTNNKIGNLRWDTHASNMADRKRHGRNQEGVKNTFAKLRPEQVLEIRRRCDSGEQQKDVAKDFGINKSCAQKIASRTTWKSIA